ncbi:copper resistance protein NlpE N-terminal domain-containing protein [Paucibacter sp. B2R-40]|uniref:copper resistance protein NlpE N-terminal domain-containing protein n=1 Tax=Paucibacter sp. B2R-40 TaxID=2893554 RepID=UPI0021E4C4D7|nr:copper resistance protein NlpE N-terminal domain-containing protein [Paucibacter sp. B2R-40]MCV2353344.1 copper resistance protein NlpE N-terminal domain-containing protein [Paucibacter sp. B2R-40]
MKQTRWLKLALSTLALVAIAACAPLADGGSKAPVADPAHSSRNALDWAGTYAGTLPCANCPGVQTRLRLNRDESFELSVQYLDRDPAPKVSRGRFTWSPNGNAITLDEQGSGRQLLVGEGRVALLPAGAAATWPQDAQRQLMRLSPLAAAELPRTLEAHRWTLVWATDAQGQPIAGLPAVTPREIHFSFSAGRFNIEGGCNRMMSGYQIDAEGKLSFSRMASTMMACEPAAMKVDAALAELLAAPLKSEVLAGTATTLRLTGPSNATLFFTGQMTPEARYGQATRVFMEVSASQVACKNAQGADAQCLQVRERRFDEQGLNVGTPGAWLPFAETIEGYTHKPGVRNVLRLKRFDRAAVGGGAPYLYVLDLVVESAIEKP